MYSLHSCTSKPKNSIQRRQHIIKRRRGPDKLLYVQSNFTIGQVREQHPDHLQREHASLNGLSRSDAEL